jgi:hypothetical protein
VLADEPQKANGAEVLLVKFVLAIAYGLDQPLFVGQHADWHDQACPRS